MGELSPFFFSLLPFLVGFQLLLCLVGKERANKNLCKYKNLLKLFLNSGKLLIHAEKEFPGFFKVFPEKLIDFLRRVYIICTVHLKKCLRFMENTWTTPETIKKELGIGKHQYYDAITELGIKSHRHKGRAYLDADQVQKLRDYLGGQTAIATVDNGELSINGDEVITEEVSDQEAEDLYWEAAELAADRLKLRNLIKLNLASKIDYERLPPELQEDVRKTADAANLNVGKLADRIANKIYERHQ